jgi:hypothetical protein
VFNASVMSPGTDSAQWIQAFETLRGIQNAQLDNWMKEKANAAKEKANALLNSDTAKAIHWYSAGILLDPTNHILYSNRSAAYVKTKEYQNALSDADRTTQLAPTWPRVHANATRQRHTELQGLHTQGQCVRVHASS